MIDKLQSLTKYQTEIKDKMSSEVPSKHKNHPQTYKVFLTKELRDVNLKLEAIKLIGDKK